MNYLLFFLLVTVVNCRGCKDQCKCPDLLDRLFEPDRNTTLYSEEAGCVRNITCGTGGGTYVDIYFSASEIPLPDNSYDYAFADSDASIQPNINVFQHFGMVCENKEWYITKYPGGITHESSEGEKTIGANGEFDGKKSKIWDFFCAPPSK